MKYLKELNAKSVLINKVFILVLFSFISCNTFGQIDLTTLIDKAIKNNRLDELYDLNTLKSINEEKMNSIFSPNISLDISEQTNLGRSFDQMSGTINPRDEYYNSTSISIKIQQQLSKLLLAKVNNTISKENKTFNNLVYLDSKKRLITNISEYYYDVLLNQELKNITLLHKEHIVELVDKNQILYNANKINKIDLLRTQKELLNIEQEILFYEERTRDFVYKLENLTLEKNITIASVDEDVKFLYHKDLISQIPEIELNKVLNKIDSLSLRKNFISNKVSINLFSSIGTYYSSRMNNDYLFLNQLDLNSFMTIGISLNLPIYSKENKSRLMINKINNEILVEERRLQNMKIEKHYEDLFQNYDDNIIIYEVLKEKTDILAEIFTLNKIKFDYNKISLIEFLESYKELKYINIESVNFKYSLLKKKFVIQSLF